MNANLLRRLNWLWKHRHTHDDDDDCCAQIPELRLQMETAADIRQHTAASVGSLTGDSRTYADSSATVSTHDLLVPASTVEGDFLYHAVMLKGQGPSGSSAPWVNFDPVPAGYSVLYNEADTTATYKKRWAFIYKVSDGTEVDGTFETDGTPEVAVVSGRIAAPFDIDSLVFSGPAGSLQDGTNLDADPISPADPGLYAVLVVGGYNAGNPSPDLAGAAPDDYESVAYAFETLTARHPRVYVAQRAVNIVTSEDPGEIGWSDPGTASFRNFRTYTVALRLDVGPGQLATGDHVHALDDLTDVTITGTPADDEILAYDTGTSEFINQTAAEAGVSATGHTHTESEVTDLDHFDTSDHAAIDAADHGSGGSTDGQVLTSDGAGGAAWEDVPAGGGLAIDDLTDVDTTTGAPVVGQTLKWNGTNWVPDDEGSTPVDYAEVSGGTETDDGTWQYNAFTTNGTLTVSSAGVVDVLVVAGGGGGPGRDAGGGAGGGGVIWRREYEVTGNVSITVGAGATGTPDNGTGAGVNLGVSGDESTFGTLTAIGGGGGGSYDRNGLFGGSGGGGGRAFDGGTPASDVEWAEGGAMYGQGFLGADGSGGTGTSDAGGGGGGAAERGVDGAINKGGDGGDGVDLSAFFSSWGDSGVFAGGGGGATHRSAGTKTPGTGGAGGGGDGGEAGVTNDGEDGTANTGGGGGAAGNTSATGGDGGSGIVIVRTLL